MAAGPAAVVAVSMGCTNLLEPAVRHVLAVARERRPDTLFAAVLPQTDAREAGVTVGASTAEAVIAADGGVPGGAGFADRRR